MFIWSSWTMSIWAHSSRGALAVKSVCIVRRQLWHFRIFGQLSLGTLRFYTFRKLGILKLKYLSRKVFGYFVNLICSLDPTSNSKLYFTKCFNQSKWLFFVYLLFLSRQNNSIFKKLNQRFAAKPKVVVGFGVNLEYISFLLQVFFQTKKFCCLFKSLFG